MFCFLHFIYNVNSAFFLRPNSLCTYIGGGAVNAKTTSDNLEKERNTWNPYDESTKESLLVQPTQQETNEIQLPLVSNRIHSTFTYFPLPLRIVVG